MSRGESVILFLAHCTVYFRFSVLLAREGETLRVFFASVKLQMQKADAEFWTVLIEMLAGMLTVASSNYNCYK